MLVHVVAALCSRLAEAPDGANRMCPLSNTSRLPDVRSLHARTKITRWPLRLEQSKTYM